MPSQDFDIWGNDKQFNCCLQRYFLWKKGTDGKSSQHRSNIGVDSKSSPHFEITRAGKERTSSLLAVYRSLKTIFCSLTNLLVRYANLTHMFHPLRPIIVLDCLLEPVKNLGE